MGDGVSLPIPPQFGCDECILTHITLYLNQKGGKSPAKLVGSSWYLTPLLWDTPSDYIAEVMGKNPHVPIFQFTLSPKDQEDLDLSITCRLPTDSNGTVKLHVGDDQSGDVLFARRRPTSKKLGKNNYLLPQPTTHTLRFLSLKDAHRQIPIYSLPTSSQLQWQPDDRFGLTTPTMMSTTDAEPLLPFPMCHPLSLIGSNEKVVPGPSTGTATNENPNAISDFGLCRYRGIFADSPSIVPPRTSASPFRARSGDPFSTIMRRLQTVHKTAPVEVPATVAWDCHYQMDRGTTCLLWRPLPRRCSGRFKR